MIVSVKEKKGQLSYLWKHFTMMFISWYQYIKGFTLLLLFWVFSSCGHPQAPADSVEKALHSGHPTGESDSIGTISPVYHFSYDTMIIGGEAYRTFDFHGIRWMIDNLNYEIKDSWCYNEDPANCIKFGRLYTWDSAVKACTKVGWRLPTDKEWNDWVDPYRKLNNGDQVAYAALLKGGESGFEAVLGGFRFDYGAFDFLNGHGYYWSSTEQDSERAWAYDLFQDYERLFRIGLYKSYGYSCRCVKEK